MIEAHHSGYTNDRADGPPRNVLSNETIAHALKQYTQSNSTTGSQSSRSSSSMPPRSEYAESHRNSRKEKGCDCADCRDHENYETESRDAQGNLIREYNGDDEHGMKIRTHRPVEPQPGKISRSSTGLSSKSSKSSKSHHSEKSSNISYSRDRDGNEVQEWNAAKGPKLRTHYDHDAPDPQFPGEAPPVKRRSTTYH